MNFDTVIASIEAEINRLEQVKALLQGTSKVINSTNPTPTIKKRTMSKASRQKIADAQRRRWAKVHKASSTKPKKVTKANKAGVPVLVEVAAPAA
jgi:hypothetical protein